MTDIWWSSTYRLGATGFSQERSPSSTISVSGLRGRLVSPRRAGEGSESGEAWYLSTLCLLSKHSPKIRYVMVHKKSGMDIQKILSGLCSGCFLIIEHFFKETTFLLRDHHNGSRCIPPLKKNIKIQNKTHHNFSGLPGSMGLAPVMSLLFGADIPANKASVSRLEHRGRREVSSELSPLVEVSRYLSRISLLFVLVFPAFNTSGANLLEKL